MASEVEGGRKLRLPALGRRFSLGQLYDCRTDSLLTGEYLWSPDAVSTFRTIVEQKGSTYDVSEDDTIEGKMTALGISDDQIKLSILGNLVPLSGASKYLEAQTCSQQQERAVLKYRCTVRLEEIDADKLVSEKISCLNVFANGTATHVVCGILFGGQTFFVFDKYYISRKQPMSLLEAVKAFPNLELTDDWNIDVSREHAQEMHDIKCKVYSDFKTPYNPTNYKDALKLFKSLSHFVERTGAEVKPIEVWLYPLTNLDPLAARVVQEVNTKLISEFQASLLHLGKVVKECFDLLNSPPVHKLSGFKTDIEQFLQLLISFRQYFRGQIGAIVKRIRSGRAEEEMMETVINRKEESPFAKQQLDIWVKQKYVQLQILKQNDIVNYVSSTKPQLSSISPPTSFIASDSTPTQLSASPPLEPTSQREYDYFICFHVSMFGKNSLTKLMSTYLNLANDGILGQFNFNTSDIPQRKKASEHTLKLAKQFKDFVDANRFSQNLRFSYVEDTGKSEKPDVYITVTKKGALLYEDYQVPTASDKPELAKSCHDKLTIKWSKPCYGSDNITGYEVLCKEMFGIYEKKVQVKCHDDNLTLTDLKLGTSYEVCVRAVCEVGFSQWSPMTSFRTLPGTPPGKPNAAQNKPDGVFVQWTKPSKVAQDTLCKGYILTVRDITTEMVSQKSIDNKKEEIILHGLNSSSSYTFSVRALFEEGETDDSEISPVLDPDPNTVLKGKLLKESEVVGSSNPAIYSLGINESFLESNEKFRKCELGSVRDDHSEKVIMVVGATGAGKTTLINGMINHTLGVKWEDKFRFQLIVDVEEASRRSQAHSQTKWITSYSLHYQEGFRVPYSLTIIDTPGYGDTGGIKKDQETTQQIHKFFTTRGNEGIDHIDAIGFVTQASQARLTPTQKFIFDQVLALFGKDIADNIFLLITFADGQTPPVLDGVKEANIPYKEYFIFNNSALYVDNDNVGSGSEVATTNVREGEHGGFGKMFWEMGEHSFVKFFEGLNKTEAKSLILTKDVLKERHSLEAYVIGVHQHIRSGLNKLEQLSYEVDILRRHEAEIETNKDFMYTVPEEIVKVVNIPSGTYITNCLTCNFTCHYPCGIPDDENKEQCFAMNGNGVCTVCPDLCEWDIHKNMTYKFDIETVMKTKTAEELKARYESANEKKLSAEELVKKVSEELEGVQLKVVYYANEIRKSLDRLKEIALRPNPLSTVEYIDILIQTEESKREAGWKDRRQQLLDIRRHAEILQLLAKPGYDPFEEYKSKFQEMRKKGEKEQTIFQSLKSHFKGFL